MTGESRAAADPVDALVRAFPLTASALAVFDGGLNAVRLAGQVVSADQAAHHALLAAARELRANADVLVSYDSPGWRQLTLALWSFEFALLQSAAALRDHLAKGLPAPTPAPLPGLPADWRSTPLRRSPFLCVFTLPMSVEELRDAVLPAPVAEVWGELQQERQPRDGLELVARARAPRVVLTRAAVAADGELVHHRMEVHIGYQDLLQAVDGHRSTADLVAAMEGSGADQALLERVDAAFERIVLEGMLHLVDAAG